MKAKDFRFYTREICGSGVFRSPLVRAGWRGGGGGSGWRVEVVGWRVFLGPETRVFRHKPRAVVSLPVNISEPGEGS